MVFDGTSGHFQPKMDIIGSEQAHEAVSNTRQDRTFITWGTQTEFLFDRSSHLDCTVVDLFLKVPCLPDLMIILFILYSLFLRLSDVLAGPLPPIYPRLEVDDHPNRFTWRSEWNIIWSCLTTLFACSWVAIHPNIPAPSENIFFIRFKIMGYMLIVPELVIMWAARQWYAARGIAERNTHRKWTTTHGFFASMGGFVLYENDIMIETLGIIKLEQLASEGRISWPSISEEDIRDKSKGDFFTKGFAVLQTTWFIVQCISRGAAGLLITELELATLAFAVLNIILYLLWWNKPLDVIRPVPVHRLQHSVTPLKPLSFPSFHLERSSSFTRFRVYVVKTLKERGWLTLIFILFIKPFESIGSSVVDMFSCHTIRTDPPPLSVPTFYSPSTPNGDRARLIGTCVGILFGAIHCIAWSFEFPSVAEKYLWRISAITITLIPLLIATFVALTAVKWIVRPVDSFIGNLHLDFEYIKPIINITICLWLVAYWGSRAMLLILPLLALRSLAPGNLLDLNWYAFIPHV